MLLTRSKLHEYGTTHLAFQPARLGLEGDPVTSAPRKEAGGKCTGAFYEHPKRRARVLGTCGRTLEMHNDASAQQSE